MQPDLIVQAGNINYTGILLVAVLATFVIFFLAILGYSIFIYFKNRDREKGSIDSVLLQVAVPRNNETKIDVMEQLFASLYSIKKGGWKQKYSVQPAISFEIVARREDIRFYVWVPKKLQDLVEKQINGAYSEAEVLEVDEYNVFEETGKVAYKTLQLGKNNFYPIKTFKDLATDPMLGITSALAKMGPGDAAVVQIIISPAESDWQKEGGKFVSDIKKQESDAEKAKFSTSGKTLEAVESKISRPGFETSIRIIAISKDEETAKGTVTNISGAFSQFSGELNSLKSRKINKKASFMEDFLYRYQPMFNLFGNHTSILNSEELATIFHFPGRIVAPAPFVSRIESKRGEAPPGLPVE